MRACCGRGRACGGPCAWANAKDKAVRFRVCQVVAGVLNAVGPEAEVDDDLYERMVGTGGDAGGGVACFASSTTY